MLLYKKMRLNKIFTSLVAFFLLAITLFLTFKAYYQRIGAFGCFDQCFNYVAAYFMLKGKTLYSQIFFNHQPLMAYLSYIIQRIFQPNTLYHLILYHRIFILLFSFLMDILLITKFRWAGVGFVLFYETTKYYLFGSFFLPEAVVAYLFAYLIGLWWKKFQKRHLCLVDYLVAGVLTWLIVFLRIPYLPTALFVYALILFPSNQKSKKLVTFSLALFLFLTLFTLLNVPLKDYLYDLFVVNYQMISNEAESLGIKGLGILKIFFYPFLILLTGKVNYLRSILIGLDIAFLTLISWQTLKLKKAKETLLIIFLLGLAAVRFVEPGTMFYEAFHLLPWYALFLMIIFLLLVKLSGHKSNRTIFYASLSLLIVLFTHCLFSPQSFIWEKVNSQEEFTINYAHYFAYGEVIKALSKPEDKLFLDMWDDLIYWQSGLDSSYQYSLYTPTMSNSQKFNQSRLAMFHSNPPDFYYSYPGASKNCLPLFPKENKNDYVQLYFADNPSCLYLKKTKLPKITNDQWEEVKKLGFHLVAPDIDKIN